MHKISAVIIALNEEKRIRQTLDSVSWCDEIIVVDSGSTDKTIDVCKEYANCKVTIQQFLGYGPQKKFAVDLSSNDWVISIDADEIITEELRIEMQKVLSQEEIPANGFMVPITHVFLGRIFRYGREYKHHHLRMFSKKNGNFNSDKIHEKLQVSGQILRLKEHILHNSYDSVHHYFEKFNSYTSIAAEGMLKKKKKVSKIGIVFKFPFSFLKFYIFDLNFLNGYPGFVWSLFSSFYRVLKGIKLLELIQKNHGISN